MTKENNELYQRLIKSLEETTSELKEENNIIHLRIDLLNIGQLENLIEKLSDLSVAIIEKQSAIRGNTKQILSVSRC
jgi:3-dehydroquinate dehydratase